MILPIFLPNIGCNQRCIYCDQTLITGIEDCDLPSYLENIFNKIESPCEIGIYGGDILGVEIKKLKEILQSLEPFFEKIKNLRVSTRPFAPKKEIYEKIELLKKYKLSVVELGIPTFNDSILQFLKRGHTVRDLEEMYWFLRKFGLNVALQVMVGLPGETTDDIKECVRNIVRLRPDYIRIYPLVIIRGTPLANLLIEGKIRLFSFEEALRRAAYIYSAAESRGIRVFKIGLTYTEKLEREIIGGFFHPAFGHMVRCHIYLEALKVVISEYELSGKITLFVNKNDLTYVYGYKGENLKFFEKIGVILSPQVSNLNRWEFRLQAGSSFSLRMDALQVFEKTLN